MSQCTPSIQFLNESSYGLAGQYPRVVDFCDGHMSFGGGLWGIYDAHISTLPSTSSHLRHLLSLPHPQLSPLLQARSQNPFRNLHHNSSTYSESPTTTVAPTSSSPQSHTSTTVLTLTAATVSQPATQPTATTTMASPRVQSNTSPPSPHVSRHYDSIERIHGFLGNPA
jgi:hypothetical protein